MIPPITGGNINPVFVQRGGQNQGDATSTKPKRSEQLAAIQAQIKSGQFQPDLSKLASAIVNSGELNRA